LVPPIKPQSGRPSPAQRLDQTRLGLRQQFREHSEIRAAGGADLQGCVHVDPDHVPSRRKPQLALAGEQNIPGLVLLLANQGVLAVGAALSIGSEFASRARQAVVAADSTVLRPSTGLEVPAAESPNNDMDASR
jgi:hypothetical protein